MEKKKKKQMGEKTFSLFINTCVFDLTHTKVNHHDVERERAGLLTHKLKRDKLLLCSVAV